MQNILCNLEQFQESFKSGTEYSGQYFTLTVIWLSRSVQPFSFSLCLLLSIKKKILNFDITW